MKKYLSAMVIAAALFTGNAQAAETSAQTPDGSEVAETNWYLDLDYAGYDFQVPAGCFVDKSSKIIVKYPDGTFGVSMTNVENMGSSQKIAFELCRRMGASMELKDMHSSREKFGKCEGAKTTGTLDGSNVTILVLPYDNQETTVVILNAPSRQAWTDHLLETLKR